MKLNTLKYHRKLTKEINEKYWSHFHFLARKQKQRNCFDKVYRKDFAYTHNLKSLFHNI